MKDKNDELFEKFFCLQKKLSYFGGDGSHEAREWNEFVKTYSKDSILEISGGSLDTINCYFSLGGWEFPFKVKLSGHFRSVNFQDSKFENGIDCAHAEFSECIFQRATFFETANFNFSKLLGRSNFDGAVFKKDAHFLYFKVSGEITFRGARFDGESVFAEIEFCENSDNSMLIDGAQFQKKASLTNFSSESNKHKGQLKQISLNHVTFDAPTVIDFKFEQCPDFSKSYFLKKYFIEETWQIDEKKFSPHDESKFRFLKKYFAEQGNHFKERQYFSYEMMAREKFLGSKISWSEIKKDFYGWLKNLSEFVLFFAYKLTSNFGMSWIRPLICLLVSALLLQSYIELPTQNYFSFFNEFFVFRTEGISFAEAILKTISPLSTAEEFKHSLTVKIHCLANATLIFLLILGLRNKFKIK
jgi:hypothetical protein